MITLAAGLLAGVLPGGAATEGEAFFEEKIRPLLAENCFKCHGPDKTKGGLRLDSHARVLKGGESGPAIIPGKPGESLLIEAVSYRSPDLEMPPKRKLGRRQVEDLAKWIALGAPWPESAGELAADDEEAGKEFEITAKDRAYWAFQPMRPRQEQDLDDLIEATHAEKKLVANATASREVLIRRAYFALIGLPPSYEEVRTFVEDSDPEAFSKLVDRLLAMPQYGERWGRHWLDVVRFAQSNGYERDDEKPNAGRYRDYVINSFNADKPYNRFVLEQIAGDELPDGGDDGWVATGFYRLGVWDDEPDDKRTAEFDGQDDILKTTTETFLGLTVGCARCHDHMFDPVSQRNYYELLAFFRNVKPYNKPGEDTIRSVGGGDALVVTEHGKTPIDTHILVRGNAGRPSERVEPRFPEILGGGIPEVKATGHSSGRRLAFAKWVAREDNPLTARVMANRLWQVHFGKGIVATPNDFGKAGQQPTNEALLDWLAAEFVASGWSIKHMHRVIMNSRAWQRSSAPNPQNDAMDPGNLHHWRANLRRMESEAIRDSILQVAGALNPERGGRGFFPAVAGEVVAGASRPGRNWQWSSPEQQRRRSVYAFVKRTMLYPFFEVFDYTNTEGSLGVRPTTTVAPQALLLLNSEFVADNAARLADLALQHPDPVSAAFRRALSRNPTAGEIELAATFLAEQEGRQADLHEQLVFRPDFPPALYKDYQRGLPPERFLRGPSGGWQYFAGKWTGDYEGIVSAEREWPAYALFGVESADPTVAGKLRLDAITKQVVILLRARPDGETYEGYSVLLDAAADELALRRHAKGSIETLGRRPLGDVRSFRDFSINLQAGRLAVRLAGEELAVVDPHPLPGDGRMGVSAWGGAVTFDRLRVDARGESYPVATLDYARSELGPVAERPTGLAPDGWTAYGGAWTSENGVVGVAREKGPKLLWDEAGVLEDGDVFKGDIRVSEGEIAGFILNVRDPKVGADNWIGYEVSLYLQEGKLVLGTHENNWRPLAAAPAPLARETWHTLKVSVSGNRVKVFLDGRAEPYLDHEMEQPLDPGLAGLRTWGARVQYRNLAVVKSDKTIAWQPREKPVVQETERAALVLLDRETTIRRRAFREFCSLLLNLNEFVYID